jgi:hypothetical protein
LPDFGGVASDVILQGKFTQSLGTISVFSKSEVICILAKNSWEINNCEF